MQIMNSCSHYRFLPTADAKYRTYSQLKKSMRKIITENTVVICGAQNNNYLLRMQHARCAQQAVDRRPLNNNML